MVLSTRMSVRILDLYFDEPMPIGVRADIVRYIQFSRPVPGANCTPVWTMLVDLTQEPSEMLSRMKSHTRYKIRRVGEKDELSCEHSDGKDGHSIARFANHHDHYASMKGLPKVSRKRYHILARQGALDLSFICDRSGDILAASSCLVTPSRVRGLHLAAAFRGTSDPSRRSLIGRANRYLRWCDMLRFRQAGVRTFDFGGWYAGSADAGKLSVNDWKAEFPGELAQEYLCENAMTLKGRLASILLQWRQNRSTTHLEAPSIAVDEGRDHEGSVSASV
jgi:hypothetical protein